MRITAVFENLAQAEAALQDLRQAGAGDAKLTLLDQEAAGSHSSEAFGDIYASAESGLSAEEGRKRPFGDTYDESSTPAVQPTQLSAELLDKGGVLVAVETDQTSLSENEVRTILNHYAVR
ncbi:hypothetical protein EHF33_12005 [Deinococcus psychrotolerans]|uniref:General stress protein 17M-like domain-containing protein n=1 Tax=Deinococcus psychrotolerans TaxID=2489213 RepID=A0A3G8YGR0_9DEIO|nr:hypothetical protein [Deinococcus psychrotolerans]AZI43377.1 hypothetical protein EHF33_12005 [Deinococcus psychrotolerans]